MIVIKLPTIEELNNWSYKTRLNKSLKTSLSKVDKKDLFNDLSQVVKYLNRKSDEISFTNRIKSIQSCKIKYIKNLKKGNNIKSSFNDVLGIRILVKEYPNIFPDYYRVVDMRNGKKNDDGYRGIHMYYQLDNYHYPIEIQVNTLEDRTFADMAHKYLYKYKSNELSLYLRKEFDNGLIKDELEFEEGIKRYEKGISGKEV